MLIGGSLVNYRHPGPRRVWDGGSALTLLTLDPVDPVDPLDWLAAGREFQNV